MAENEGLSSAYLALIPIPSLEVERTLCMHSARCFIQDEHLIKDLSNLSGMTYPPTAPGSGDTAPGASPVPVNVQRRGEGWTPLLNIPSNDRENPSDTYHATAKSLRCWNRRGKLSLVNYTQVDIKSKEYKVTTGQSYILNRGGQTGTHRPGICTCLVN